MDVLVSAHKKKKKKAVLSAGWKSGMVKIEDGWKDATGKFVQQ